MRHFQAGLLLAVIIGIPAAAQDVAEGARLYQHHCATCHGLKSDGKGPMAPALLVQPTDLTALQRRNGGDFPLLRVIKRIDGRDPLVSHGSSMPVFGEFFEGFDVGLKTETGQPVMTSQPVADIVAWMRTIQQ